MTVYLAATITQEYATYYGKIIQYIMLKTIQYNRGLLKVIVLYNSMIGESLLLLLKGHSTSHITCKALCPFQLKCILVVIRVTRLNTKQHGIFIIVLTVHKYEESSVDFNLYLNCCKLGNCIMSLARPFHMCIYVYQ